MTKVKLNVDIAGFKMENPCMNAAGVLGMTPSILKRVYESGAGAVITKSIGPEPREGHPNPTLVPYEYGALNAMGLPNPGAEYFSDEIRQLKEMGVPVVASFFGGSVEEFVDVAIILSDAGSDALELNGSCPNVAEEMGMLAADAENVEIVTAAVKDETDIPLFVKLSPNVTDITSIAEAAERGGADAITAVNTLKGMAIDIDFRRPILTNITGGLSGQAVKPVALRCVWEISEAVNIPVIGCGGINSWRDAIEYLLAGATALELGTALMNDELSIYRRICEGISLYLQKHGFNELKEVVGLAHEGKY
ncbi:dihydroorotate dehydrogenase [Candidatus Bathyarchaeota archaeon]|nr:dihydroorotate dehydrogenase [Candidatus Bathyarchaeota archaeon]